MFVAMFAITRFVIKKFLALLAFIVCVSSILMRMHQMILDALCAFIRIILFIATRPYALSPFNLFLDWILWSIDVQPANVPHIDSFHKIVCGTFHIQNAKMFHRHEWPTYAISIPI